MLIEASTAEAEAVSAVWRAAKEASAASSEGSLSEGIGSESPLSETSPTPADFDDEGSQEPDVKLYSRAVCILMKIPSISIFKLSDGSLHSILKHLHALFFYLFSTNVTSLILGYKLSKVKLVHCCTVVMWPLLYIKLLFPLLMLSPT
jgi:hypothetical protein